MTHDVNAVVSHLFIMHIAILSSPLDDKALQAAVEHGHKWWILSEKITAEEAILVSEYRNSDQNTNQVFVHNVLPTWLCVTTPWVQLICHLCFAV